VSTDKEITWPILAVCAIGAFCYFCWPGPDITATVGGILFWLVVAAVAWAHYRGKC
jgi:hypothetical protein